MNNDIIYCIDINYEHWLSTNFHIEIPSIIYCIDINYEHCLSTKKPLEDVKLANNDFQGAFEYLRTSFASLTEKCVSEHENSVIQNILLS